MCIQIQNAHFEVYSSSAPLSWFNSILHFDLKCIQNRRLAFAILCLVFVCLPLLFIEARLWSIPWTALNIFLSCLVFFPKKSCSFSFVFITFLKKFLVEILCPCSTLCVALCLNCAIQINQGIRISFIGQVCVNKEGILLWLTDELATYPGFTPPSLIVSWDQLVTQLRYCG